MRSPYTYGQKATTAEKYTAASPSGMIAAQNDPVCTNGSAMTPASAVAHSAMYRSARPRRAGARARGADRRERDDPAGEQRRSREGRDAADDPGDQRLARGRLARLREHDEQVRPDADDRDEEHLAEQHAGPGGQLHVR